MTAIKLTQAQVKRSIADWANHQGGYAVVMNISGIPIKGNPHAFRKNPDMAGMGDIMICWRSKMIQVEVKKPNEQLNPNQVRHKERTLRAGGTFLTVTDFADFLNQMIEGNYIRE